MSRVHHFADSGTAYDAVQVGFTFDDAETPVNVGDVLVIASEGVVGIADTWPIAVTEAHGALHTPAKGWTVARCMDATKAAHGVAAAFREAARLGLAVRP